MGIDLKQLLGLIENSDFGITLENSAGTRNIKAENGNFETVRKLERIKEGCIIDLNYTNTSGNPRNALFLKIFDLTLPNDIYPDLVLEHGWLQSSKTTFKKLTSTTKKNRIFYKRDQNPFSFDSKYGYLRGSVVSEWFTILKFGEEAILIGALTTNKQFTQIFLKDEGGRIRLRVVCQLDGVRVGSGDKCESEKIVLLSGKHEDVSKLFVKLVSKEMKTKKTTGPIKALCSPYYWKGNFVSEEIINDELDTIENLSKRPNFDYIQIDAGYSDFFGDWLSYNNRFPAGMERVVKRINSLGYKAGIWLTPFIASPESDVFAKHRDWFLKDDNGKLLKAKQIFPFDELLPSFRLRALDPTNKDCRNYLVGVIKHFVNIGFELFKIESLYPMCFSTRYSVPMTSAQATRSALELVREAVGDSTHILVAVSPVSTLVGLADSARMGRGILSPNVTSIPVLNSFVNNRMFKSNLESNKYRRFLNGAFWTNDPNCLVFRKGTGISSSLIEEHKDFVRKERLNFWVGDSLTKLDNKEMVSLLEYFGGIRNKYI